jgi:hypothetical protein
MDASEERTFKFGLTLAALVVAFVLYECVRYGKDVLYGGIRPCITAVFDGVTHLWLAVAGTVGVAAAPTVLVSCVVIPATTVSIL